MSTLTPTRKVSRRHELREDKVITLSARVLDFFENNRTLVYGVFAGIIVLVAFILYYTRSQASLNSVATEEMSTAVTRYESGEFAAALDGDINFKGLLEIIDEYGGTDAGNLAKFYAADAFFRQGIYDRALELFKEVDKTADYLGARALAGEAAVYENQGDSQRAGQLYLQAASQYENEAVTPEYLMQAGQAFEDAGDAPAALRTYRQIKDDYPDAPQARDIDFFISRIAAGTTS